MCPLEEALDAVLEARFSVCRILPPAAFSLLWTILQ